MATTAWLGRVVALRVLLRRANARFGRVVEEVSPSDAAAVGRLDAVTGNAVMGDFRYVT